MLGLTNRRGDRPTVVVDTPFHFHHSQVTLSSLTGAVAVPAGGVRAAVDARSRFVARTRRCDSARCCRKVNANDNSKRWITRLVCR
jgi:Trm5-related predicted tRNA methylase